MVGGAERVVERRDGGLLAVRGRDRGQRRAVVIGQLLCRREGGGGRRGGRERGGRFSLVCVLLCDTVALFTEANPYQRVTANQTEPNLHILFFNQRNVK